MKRQVDGVSAKPGKGVSFVEQSTRDTSFFAPRITITLSIKVKPQKSGGAINLT
jgi:hypothetical protein